MVSPAPTSDSFDQDPKGVIKPSRSWIQWVNQVVSALNGVVNYAAALQVTVVNGFSYQLQNGQQILTLMPASTIGSGSIIMPPNPVDGAFVQVSTTATITAFSVAPSGGGQTVLNPPSTLVAGTGFSYYYKASNSTWYKLS